MQDKKAPAREHDPVGLAIGLFLVLGSLLTFAEYAGLIPAIKWGLPTFWLIVGGVVLYNSISRR